MCNRDTFFMCGVELLEWRSLAISLVFSVPLLQRCEHSFLYLKRVWRNYTQVTSIFAYGAILHHRVDRLQGNTGVPSAF